MDERKKPPCGGGEERMELAQIYDRIGQLECRFSQMLTLAMERQSEWPPQDVRESVYYVRWALSVYLKEKHPEQGALIDEICELVGKVFKEATEFGGGGEHLYENALDYVREMVADHLSISGNKTRVE